MFLVVIPVDGGRDMKVNVLRVGWCDVADKPMSLSDHCVALSNVSYVVRINAYCINPSRE